MPQFYCFLYIKLVSTYLNDVIYFEKEIKTLEEVTECYHISSEYDYLIKVMLKNIDEFIEFIVKKLTNINLVESSHSMLMISQIKHSTTINL